MILRGPEYLESDQKRWLDQLLCRALGIVATPVRDYTARRLADELGLVLSEVHMQQARKSQAGDVVIPKLRTLPWPPTRMPRLLSMAPMIHGPGALAYSPAVLVWMRYRSLGSYPTRFHL